MRIFFIVLGAVTTVISITYLSLVLFQQTTYSKEKIRDGIGHQVKQTFNEEKQFIKPSILLDAPHIQQLPELPRGCEVTSLSMLLQYAGEGVGKMALADEIPKVPYKSEGLYGDPRDGFVGNMYEYTKPGLSVYSGPVLNLGDKYLQDGLKDLTGQSFKQIKQSLSLKKPVWVILSSNYDVVESEHWENWETKRGSIEITKKVHSVLLTGYDEDYVYFNDPLYHKKNRKITKQNFLIAWNQFGNQAITLK